MTMRNPFYLTKALYKRDHAKGNFWKPLVGRSSATDRNSIRKLYCDVLGGKITKEENERDFLRMGEHVYIVWLYEDVPDESEFLRTARSVWLEIKSDNVEEMRAKKSACPVSSGSSIYRTPTSTFKHQKGNACG